MTFDTVFERSYPPNTTMSERDKNTANRIARQLTTEGVFYEGRLRQLTDEIVTALTTARKEAREAAFREMIGLAQAVRPDGSINFVGDWNRARKQFIALIEAAANIDGEQEKR